MQLRNDLIIKIEENPPAARRCEISHQARNTEQSRSKPSIIHELVGKLHLQFERENPIKTR